MKLFVVLLAAFLTLALAQDYEMGDYVDYVDDAAADDAEADYDYDYDESYAADATKVGTGALVLAATLATVMMF